VGFGNPLKIIAVYPNMSLFICSETVVLDPALVWTNDETKDTLDAFNKELKTCKGRAMEEILLRFYARTAEVKAKAVW